jgi:ribosomal protein L33
MRTEIHRFKCTECGNYGIPIPRKNSRLRPKGHFKHLFCIHCNKVTKHIEVRDGDEVLG